MKRSLISLLILLAPFVWLECSEDEESNAGFELSSGSGKEGDSVQYLNINLGRTLSSSITITIYVSGTATLDGDFSFTPQSSSFSTTPPTEGIQAFKVKSGESSIAIPFTIIDDDLVESVDDIFFQIVDVSDNDIASSITNVVFEYTIFDNDSPPDDGMQVDLSWDLGDNISINNANFDLYLATDIVLNSNGEILSSELSDQVFSKHKTGFETYHLDTDLPDGQYYIAIHYVSGSSNARVQLTFSYGISVSSAIGVIPADYSGENIYYGPLNKTGSSITTPR